MTLNPKEVLIAIATFFALVSIVGVIAIRVLLIVAKNNENHRNSGKRVEVDAPPTFTSSTGDIVNSSRSKRNEAALVATPGF